MQVGVISDTHGLLRPEAVDALTSSDLILHAGDIGKPEVLDGLRAIAPVMQFEAIMTMARGQRQFLSMKQVEIAGVSVYLLPYSLFWQSGL